MFWNKRLTRNGYKRKHGHLFPWIGMFAKAATTLFLVSPLASTSKKSQKVYRIVGLNSPTYPHFSWYLGSHGNPVHTGIRGPCWRSQTSCSMSLLAQDLVLARNIHYRGVMIPALDLCQESDFQLFGDSKSIFGSNKNGIRTPRILPTTPMMPRS